MPVSRADIGFRAGRKTDCNGFIALEDGLQPLHGVSVYADGIKPAVRNGACKTQSGQRRQVPGGGQSDALLFGRCDAGRCRAMGLPAAMADFNDNQRALICAKDGVQFTERAAQIAGKQHQATRLQPFDRPLFGLQTGALGG